MQREIDELASFEQVELPQKVDLDKRHHVVLFGPVGCGKTAAARHLAKSHKRCVINMGELFEWNRSK